MIARTKHYLGATVVAAFLAPILSSILTVTFDRDVDQYQAPFTLKPEDHFSLALGNIVTLDDGSGKSAVFELVTNFPDTWPDPISIYRNSPPLRRDDASSRSEHFVHGRCRHESGPANQRHYSTHESGVAVPECERRPIRAIQCHVLDVNPITGENHTYIANLNAAIDVECAAGPAPNTTSFFVAGVQHQPRRDAVAPWSCVAIRLIQAPRCG